MKKRIFILVGIFSCGVAKGQDSTNRGFEFGLTAVAYNGLVSSYFLPEFYTTPRFQLFNGVQMNFNLDRMSFRGHFNYSNDGKRCTHCSGGAFFVRNRQLKFGLQYYLRKKTPDLYSYFDLSATKGKSNGEIATDSLNNPDEPYTFESNTRGLGWDAGFGYKLKVFRNFSVVSEVGVNPIDGRTNGQGTFYNNGGQSLAYYYRYKEVWLGARLILTMKIQ